jgi:hypothetical protein
MRSFAWVGKAVHGVGANALSNLLLVELTKEGCSWMLAMGLFSFAAVANQVVIELFRRGQAGKADAFSSSHTEKSLPPRRSDGAL